MSYNFKKLAEVEEIQEVTPTTKAFVEVDGEVKRAPYGAGGGGSKIEDLRFDLDIEETEGNTYISFTNMEQIKKVLDNDMNIVIIFRNSGCCGITVYSKEYYRCNTTAKLSGTSAVIPFVDDWSSSHDSYSDSQGAITVTFETEERLTPVSAKSRKYIGEVIAAYATI